MKFSDHPANLLGKLLLPSFHGPMKPFLLLFLVLWLRPAPLGLAATSTDEPDRMVVAARRLLETLNDDQRGKLLFEFGDEAQRRRWSNLPTGIFRREGLRLGDLTRPQHDAVLALLAAALSPQGYEKVLQIIEGDEVLRKSERSGRLIFGRDEFYLSLLGKPSATEPWMIQFGGHHLAINLTLVGKQGTLAPSLPAAQPAVFELDGKTVRPLGREVDKAWDLFASLDESQRRKAVLGSQIRDLVLGPGKDGRTLQPEGVKGSDLTEKQREMLLGLAGEWTGMQQEAGAVAKMEELRKNISETWFAWSGPAEKGKAAYFRIQGPTVHIEFAPQTMGGDPTRHIHTIYRDPTNDYGARWVKH